MKIQNLFLSTELVQRSEDFTIKPREEIQTEEMKIFGDKKDVAKTRKVDFKKLKVMIYPVYGEPFQFEWNPIDYSFAENDKFFNHENSDFSWKEI